MNNVEGQSKFAYLVKIGLFTGVAWGLSMALLGVGGWNVGGLSELPQLLISSAACGLLMALVIGGMHLFATKTLKDPTNVRPERRLQLAGEPREILDRVAEAMQQLPGAKSIKTDPAAGTAKIRVGMTWRSFGEVVTARVEPDAPETCRVHLRSVPRIKTTLVDYGANARNLAFIEERLGGIAEVFA